METPPFFAVQKQIVDGVITIVASDYTLDPNDIDPTSDFRVFADVLTIPQGTFSLPGRNVTLFAREMNFGADAVLDVSGAGWPDFVLPIIPPKAASGSGYGDAGQRGLDGGTTADTVGKKGRDAGNVTITASAYSGYLTVNARGGQGQQGQGGQDGGDGIVGPPGDDAVCSPPQTHDHTGGHGRVDAPAKAGGQGGNAGDGGNAGKSGDGGKGGVVATYFPPTDESDAQDSFDQGLFKIPIYNVNAFTDGGRAGLAAKVGSRGTAGGGGLGGRLPVLKRIGNEVIWQLGDDRQGGSQPGGAGSDGSPAPAAHDGDAGSWQVRVHSDLSDLLIQDECLLSQLLLMMRTAEISYLENDFQTARAYYEWIGGLTAKASGADGLNAEFAALHQQCVTLIAQLNQGLDFFANPINYVPLVTLDYYQQALEGMLDTGTSIEATYNAYTQYLQSQTAEFTKMQDAVDDATDVINTCKKVQADDLDKITALGPVIDQLSDSMAVQYGVLLQADADFQKAVEQATTGGCSFSDLLGLLKSIIAVGENVENLFNATTLKGVVTNLKDITDFGTKVEDGKLIQQAKPVGGDVSDIANAWESINPSHASNVDDSQKLILQEKDFDKAIQPYLDLPEAQVYKARVHDYIGVAQSRNAKLQEYTNAAVQYKAMDARIAQKTAELDRIRKHIADQNVPGIVPYRNFLFGLYQDFKGICLRYLYQEYRAYVYWSQEDVPFQLVDDSFVGLRKLHDSFSGGIIDKLNSYKQAILSQPLNLKIVLTEDGADNRSEQFQAFRTSHSLTFKINPDEASFSGWANILVSSFSVYLPDAGMSASGNLYLELLHQGRVDVVSPDGTKRDFTHNQVRAVYEYTLDDDGKPVQVGGGSLGGDELNNKVIALSPIATFTLRVPPIAANQGVDLSRVKKIEFHFSGYADASNVSRRKA